MAGLDMTKKQLYINKRYALLFVLCASSFLGSNGFAATELTRSVSSADESIYVVQERAFSKRHRFELTPIFYNALNPKFVGHLGAALGAAYHIRENLAVELLSSVPGARWSYFSNLVEDVYYHENLAPEAVDLKHLQYFGAASLQLSALYGKFRFSIFNWSTLIDYDAYLTAGVGTARTLETCQPNLDGCSDIIGAGRGLRAPTDTNDRWKLTGNLGGGMRFFFSDMFGLRLEVRDVVYADRDVDSRQTITTDIRNNLLLFLGLSLLI